MINVWRWGEEAKREVYYIHPHTPQTQQLIESEKERMQLPPPKSHAQKIEGHEHVVHFIYNTDL